MHHLDVWSYVLCLDPCCTWDLLSPYTDKNLNGTVLSTRCTCFPNVSRKGEYPDLNKVWGKLTVYVESGARREDGSIGRFSLQWSSLSKIPGSWRGAASVKSSHDLFLSTINYAVEMYKILILLPCIMGTVEIEIKLWLCFQPKPQLVDSEHIIYSLAAQKTQPVLWIKMSTWYTSS